MTGAGATRSRVLVAVRVAAAPERAFAVFVRDIGEWWRPSDLFRFTTAGGRMAFEPETEPEPGSEPEPGPGDEPVRPLRLVEISGDGERFKIGEVSVWDPPHRLVFGWRQASFTDEQRTEVAVRFDPVDGGTLVTVEHFGWDAVPQQHVARHGFPLKEFQQRHAEWWQVLLGSLRDQLA